MPFVFGKLFDHRNIWIEDRNCLHTMLGCDASQWHWGAATHIADHYEEIWRLYGATRFTFRSRFKMVPSTRLQVHNIQFSILSTQYSILNVRCLIEWNWIQHKIKSNPIKLNRSISPTHAYIFHISLFTFHHRHLVMLLLQLDVRHVRALNANALAVMLTFATIVKLNGIRIKRVMQHVRLVKVQCEHHLEV